MRNKLLVFTLILLSLVIFSQYQKPIASILDLDPPSIYNIGPGGITFFYNYEKTRRSVQIIYSLDELKYFDSRNNVLLILGPDKDVGDIDTLFSWIEKGGVAVVGDELNHSKQILDYIGIEQGNVIPGVGEAWCIIGNKAIEIVIDVAKALQSSNSRSNVLCLYGSMPVAYNVSYGNGYIIVIGDSSIVINEILAKPSISVNNSLFMDYIIGGKGLIIYEGGRVYRPVEAQVIAQAMSFIVDGLSDALQWLLFRQGVLSLLGFFTGLAILSMLYLTIRFGIVSSPRKYLSSAVQIDRKFIENIRRQILAGVDKWQSTRR
ncbi:MAG: hypothetical protein QW348_06530 [Ignisphaera sp.]